MQEETKKYKQFQRPAYDDITGINPNVKTLEQLGCKSLKEALEKCCNHEFFTKPKQKEGWIL